MKNSAEKVAYLKGLIQGINYPADSNEGNIFRAITDALDALSDEIARVKDESIELEEYIESVDESLFNLEKDFYEECCDDDDDCGCGCGHDHEDEYVEVECPSCHEKVFFEDDILYDDDIIEVTCPNCEEVVFINSDEDDEEEIEDEEK